MSYYAGKSKQFFFTGVNQKKKFTGCKTKMDIYYRGKTQLTLFCVERIIELEIFLTMGLRYRKSIKFHEAWTQHKHQT